MLLRNRSFRSEPWLTTAFASLGSSAAVYFGSVNEADNDLWMHLFVGRLVWESGTIPRSDSFSYTAAGHPWVNHEWLAQWAAYGLFHQAGGQALWLAKLVMVASMVAIVWRSIVGASCSRAGLRGPDGRNAENGSAAAPPWVWGPVLVLVIAASARGLSFRPQLWTYVLLPLLLWGLHRWSLGHRAWGGLLPVVFLLWVNLHGGFVLGLGILGLFACWGVFSGAREVVERSLVLAASGLATLANPYGFSLYPYLLDELGRWHPISEWQAVTLGDRAHLPFFALLCFFAATLPWARNFRSNGWQIVLALGTAYVAFLHQRHTPVFALCVALPLAQQWRAAGWWLAMRGVGLRPAATALLAAGVLLLAATQLAFVVRRIAFENGSRIVFAADEYPIRLVAALREVGATGNVAVPLDWGGYLLWHLAPRIRPSLDGRFATVFPPQVVEDNFAFYSGGRGWRRLLEAYPTEAVLLASGAIHPLRQDGDWVELASDGVASLWVRRGLEPRFAVGALSAEPPRERWALFP